MNGRRCRGLIRSLLGIIVLFSFCSLGFALTDANWKDDVNGNGSDPTKWDINAIPGSTHHVYLPIWDGNLYTVTVDGSWTIGDLDSYWNSTISLGGYTLVSNSGSTIRGTLDIRGGQFNNDGSGNMGMTSTAKLVGYGTVGQDITGDNGEIRAQGGTLAIGLEGNDLDNAHVYVENGAALNIRNTHDVTLRAPVSMLGGTLRGYQYYTYTLINNTGEEFSGSGTVSDYRFSNLGTLTASGGVLSLTSGFLSDQAGGAINIQNNGTLDLPNTAWTNYGTITMAGGGITGQTMSQNAFLSVTGGTNSIQNVTFYNGATVGGGATLQISGAGSLNGAAINESGAGGYFNVGTGATVSGYGTVNPDMTVNGTLAANSSGHTLAVNGALAVQSGKTAYASGGGTLDINNTVVNGGSLSATSGGTTTVDGSATNTGTLYSTGTGSTLTLSSNVYNRNSIYAGNWATLTVTGTIKAGAGETGDFLATAYGTMNLAGATVETNVRNTFTASTGSTINLWSNPNTGILYQTEALKPQGGTFNITSGQTLTNASGKSIRGYGTLLGDGRNLTNQGSIEADGGTLDVHGNITNTGTMRAASGYTLNVGSTLSNNTNGSIYAQANSTVNLNSADLTNDSAIYATGSGALVTVADTVPQGTGTFTADAGGTIRFADGFTNSGLGPNALRVTGGKLTAAGTLTNVQSKTISGYGTLLDSGITLNNSGTVAASGGNLLVAGNVSNGSLMAAGGADSLQVSGTLTNSVGGIVRSENGGQITLGSVTNDGTIEIVGGAGAGRIGFGSASGGGRYVLDQGQMRFANLTMSAGAFLDDNSLSGSSLSVLGNLIKMQGAQNDFNADRLATQVYNPAMTGFTHLVQWDAEDRGAVLHGLDDNLVLGHVTLGDGLGLPKTDQFRMTPESFLYCYGLAIKSDATLDLQGATIYYLRSGVEYNGVTGTGFDLEGGYANGQIIEIVPEPVALALLVLGAVTIVRRKSS